MSMATVAWILLSATSGRHRGSIATMRFLRRVSRPAAIVAGLRRDLPIDVNRTSRPAISDPACDRRDRPDRNTGRTNTNRFLRRWQWALRFTQPEFIGLGDIDASQLLDVLVRWRTIGETGGTCVPITTWLAHDRAGRCRGRTTCRFIDIAVLGQDLLARIFTEPSQLT